MVDEGYAATQILGQLHEAVIEHDLSDQQKSVLTEKMAVSDLMALRVKIKTFTNPRGEIQ